MDTESNKKSSFSFKKLPWPWIALCVILAVVSLALVNKYGGELSQQAVDKSQRQVTLYFTSGDGKHLSKEAGVIKKGNTEAELLALMERLIKGSGGSLERTIPVGAFIKSVRVKGKIALVDFSGHIKTKHWGGSTAELLTIYSIVNTITDNIAEIKMVQILIEGERFDTLAGHLRIDSPIGPKSDMIEG